MTSDILHSSYDKKDSSAFGKRKNPSTGDASSWPYNWWVSHPLILPRNGCLHDRQHRITELDGMQALPPLSHGRVDVECAALGTEPHGRKNAAHLLHRLWHGGVACKERNTATVHCSGSWVIKSIPKNKVVHCKNMWMEGEEREGLIYCTKGTINESRKDEQCRTTSTADTRHTPSTNKLR